MTIGTLPETVGFYYPLKIKTLAGTYSCMGNCVRTDIPGTELLVKAFVVRI